jgi:hypothetical protein
LKKRHPTHSKPQEIDLSVISSNVTVVKQREGNPYVRFVVKG